VKPYYEDDAVTIYHGDCREVLPSLEARSAHLLATDPPYFRTVDAEWDDQWGADAEEFLRWIGDLMPEFNRVMADRATLGVFCSPDLACGVELAIRRVFAVLNHIVWRKPNPGRLGQMDKDSMRRFFPVSERLILAEKCRNPDGDLFRFRDHVNHAVARDVYADVRQMLCDARDAACLTNRQVDEALGTVGMSGHYFGSSQWCLPTKEAWDTVIALAPVGVSMPTWELLRYEFDSRRREFDSRRREFDSVSQDWELLSDVWTFGSPKPTDRFGHPTQKPLGIMRHIITTMSRRDDLVLDPFMGSGSTLRAAKDLGRNAIGIEIEERYCELAAKRCAQEVLDFGEAA
jgi:site-specific DNA-methyltransferase (adenine-specific)